VGSLVALALTLVVLVAACGEGEQAGQPQPPETSIEVTFWPDGADGGGGQHSELLTCGPPGGSHPDPEGACAAIEDHEDALAPVPGDVACTQIYGGPDEALVAGVIEGRAVEARLNRSNGCEIDRWDRLAPLLDVLPG
jgi:Subtilisin inhibitor-like